MLKDWVRHPALRLGLSIAFGGLMVYLALRNVRLAEVWDILSNSEERYLALAIFSVAVNIWAKAVRWRVLVGPVGNRVPFYQLLKALLIGQTLNWFIPGRVGELSRAYVIGGMGLGRSYILGTVALEKVLDLISYALLFLALFFLLPLPAWLSDSGYSLTILTVAITSGLILLAARPEWFIRQVERLVGLLPERLQQAATGRFEAGIASMKILRQRRELLKVAAWSAVVWGSAVWTNQLTALTLGIRLPWSAALLVLVVLQAGIVLPTVPGRIGVFQYLCILALALFNVDQAMGLSFGILLQAIVLLPPTLVSLPFFGMLGGGGLETTEFQQQTVLPEAHKES